MGERRSQSKATEWQLTQCMRQVSSPGSPIETREILMKSDRVSVVFERIEGDKIRVTTSSWDDAKMILPNQVL